MRGQSGVVVTREEMGEGVARGRGQLVLRWERWRRELSDVVKGEPPWSEKRGKVFAQIAEKKVRRKIYRGKSGKIWRYWRPQAVVADKKTAKVFRQNCMAGGLGASGEPILTTEPNTYQMRCGEPNFGLANYGHQPNRP
jgi:hypothetical protein